MSDEHDDATTGTAGDSAAEDGAKQARPTGKRGGRRGNTALAEQVTKGVTEYASRNEPEKPPRRNPFAAIWLFLRQVVAELRKVIWPTRSQMINYTIIVLVFVVVLTAFVSLLDLGFAKLMLWAFG